MKDTQKHIIAFLLICFVSSYSLSAQEQTSTDQAKTRYEAYQSSLKNQNTSEAERSMTASFTTGFDSELLESKLEYNSCVELAQISINIVDGINQIGTFSNGIAGAGLQIDEGVVLSTGTITEMFTNNNAVLVSEGVSDANTIADSDFDNLDPGGQTTHNESILILDFTVPPGLDGIRVPFQFASDEYPEYVGTQFNDVFGFFVSGPGFPTSTNIALVPGTNYPIAVNSINGGSITNQGNVDSYPATGSVYFDYSEYFIDNTDGTSNGPIIGEYDGYSTLLYAEVAGLIPGETYQLKLGIADIADHYGDSGVYIGPLEGLYTGEPIVDCFCDLENPDLDCDKDGVLNGVDCDPEDASISDVGDVCVDSNGDEGLIDENCVCIGSAGGISGGNSGGLESNNRLAQKIAKRNFNRKIRPDEIDYQKENGEIPFNKKKYEIERNSDLDLSAVIPTNIWGAFIAESTPDDLVGITNAVDVIAADYYLNDVRNAVVMAIESENGVYEHSKYICDRLDGASLLDVKYINISQGQFIVYKIQTLSNSIEYAISFSGYLSNGSFEVENFWNLDKYSEKDQFYNFQIWASSIEKTESLVITILENIENQFPISNVSTGTIPASFVSNGYYKNGNLHLEILHKSPVDQLDFQVKYRETETAELSFFETSILTNQLPVQNVIIETGYLYDMGLSMIIDESHSDELFVADGTWGFDDFNPNSDLLEFNILNQSNIFDESVYGLERGIQVLANVKDYQNIFRSITPKWKSVDLSEFNSINFKAKGTGQIQLTVVSNEVENWNEQLSIKFDLSEETNEFNFDLKDFKNYNHESDLQSINMIMLTIIGNNNSFETSALTLTDFRFENKIISASVETMDEGIVKLFPNPVQGQLHVELAKSNQKINRVSVYDAQGVKTLEFLNNDQEQINIIDLEFLPSGLYFIEIVDLDGKIYSDRFIKD